MPSQRTIYYALLLIAAAGVYYTWQRRPNKQTPCGG